MPKKILELYVAKTNSDNNPEFIGFFTPSMLKEYMFRNTPCDHDEIDPWVEKIGRGNLVSDLNIPETFQVYTIRKANLHCSVRLAMENALDTLPEKLISPPGWALAFNTAYKTDRAHNIMLLRIDTKSSILIRVDAVDNAKAYGKLFLPLNKIAYATDFIREKDSLYSAIEPINVRICDTRRMSSDLSHIKNYAAVLNAENIRGNTIITVST